MEGQVERMYLVMESRKQDCRGNKYNKLQKLMGMGCPGMR
jgi:hypothetical protein